MITDADMRNQVIRTLEPHVDDYNIDEIMREIIAEHGRIDVDRIEPVKYWTIVAKHDSADCYNCGHAMIRHLGERCSSTDESDNTPCRCTVGPAAGTT